MTCINKQTIDSDELNLLSNCINESLRIMNPTPLILARYPVRNTMI